MAGQQATRQDRLKAISDLEKQVDTLRQVCEDLANRRRSAYSPFREPRPDNAEEKALWVAKRAAASGQLAPLGKEIKGWITPVHLLRQQIDQVIDECCQWHFDGDFRDLKAWRRRINKVCPIEQQDVDEHGCEPLLAVLRVYKAALADIRKSLTAGIMVPEWPDAAATAPANRGAGGSRGPDPDEDRNKTIAEKADGINSGRLSDDELLKLCVEMDSTPHPYCKTKPELAKYGDINWVAAFDLRLYENIRSKVHYARKMHRKLQANPGFVQNPG